MLCQAKPSVARSTVSWVGGERSLCGKGELAGLGGERFLATGGSQLPVECSMLFAYAVGGQKKYLLYLFPNR
jgi:hypothetical protein